MFKYYSDNTLIIKNRPLIKSISSDGRYVSKRTDVEDLQSRVINHYTRNYNYGNAIADNKKLDYQSLRAIAEKAYLINILIGHCIRITTPFIKPSTADNIRGFKIRLKNSEAIPTDKEKKKIEYLTQFFLNTGRDKNNERGSLLTFIRKGIRDLLTLDQVTTELQYSIDNRSLFGFWAIDPATIRRVFEGEVNDKGEQIHFKQFVNGVVVESYTKNRLLFDIMNPRSDIEHSFYGYSYVEQAIDLVLALIKSTAYNIGNFDSDMLPRGIILIDGDPDQSSIRAFQDTIINLMSNPSDKWRIPVLPSGVDGGGIRFEKFGQTNKDMEYSELTNRICANVGALWGIDLEEVGIRVNTSTSVIGENVDGRIQASKSRVLGDILTFFSTHFQEILEKVDSRFVFEFVGFENDDITKKDAHLKSQLEYRSINEIRALEGLEPIEDEACNLPLNQQFITLRNQLEQAKQQAENGDFGGLDDLDESDENESNFGDIDKSIDNGLKKSHKYTSKELINGYWRYYYPDGVGSGGGDASNNEVELAKQTKLIEDKHLKVTRKNALKVGKEYLKELRDKWNKTPFLCPELDNRRVVINSDSINHLSYTSDKKRDMQNIIRRVELFPYIEDIIKNGKFSEKRIGKRDQKLFDYSLVGRGIVNNKEIGIKVILAEKEKGSKLLHLSIFDFDIEEMKKSSHGINTKIVDSTSKGIRRLDYFSLDKSTAKIQKSQVEKSQKEKPQDKMTIDFLETLDKDVNKFTFGLYKYICDYLDLPTTTIQKAIVQKAINKPLIIDGKIIMQQNSDMPLTTRDFNNLIKSIEKHLNRNRRLFEKKITLGADAIGRIKTYLLKNNSAEAIKQIDLEKVKYKNTPFREAVKDFNRWRETFKDITTDDYMVEKLRLIKENTGKYIQDVNSEQLATIKDIIFNAVKEGKSKGEIASELFDEFAHMNRDLKVIANTEVRNIENEAFINSNLATTKVGEKVYFQRLVGSANTCQFCLDSENTIALWSDKELADDSCDDGVASIYIWAGKTNIGRHHKNWWIPVGATHPNCHCEWSRYFGY